MPIDLAIRTAVLVVVGCLAGGIPWPAAGDISTLGIDAEWDYNVVNRTLEQKGIPSLAIITESDEEYEKHRHLYGPHEIVSEQFFDGIDAFVRTALAELGAFARSGALQPGDAEAVHAGRSGLTDIIGCGLWRGGLERRAEIIFIAICFDGLQQMLLAEFFRAGHTHQSYVEKSLREEHGEPAARQWWVEYQDGAPAKYIFLPEISAAFSRRFSLSAAAVHFSARALEQRGQAAEDARKEQR